MKSFNGYGVLSWVVFAVWIGLIGYSIFYFPHYLPSQDPSDRHISKGDVEFITLLFFFTIVFLLYHKD